MFMITCEPQCRIEALTTPAKLNAIKEPAGPDGEKIRRVIEFDLLLSCIALGKLYQPPKVLL